MDRTGGLIFISCGQVTDEEKELGHAVRELVSKLTPHTPYFAENQSSLDGVTKNILGNLDDAVALIAIMHHRGRVIFPDGTEHMRASVWIEQEMAIAAFIRQVLNRNVQVIAYIQEGIHLEGLRDKIQLNARKFKTNADVLADLEKFLPDWKDLPARLKVPKDLRIHVRWVLAEFQNYLFEFVNEEDETAIVREIVLMYDGIHLTEPPLRPLNSPDQWKLNPRSTNSVGRPIAGLQNPAHVLVAVSKNMQSSFRETVDAIIRYSVRNEIREVTRRFSVRVDRFKKEINGIW